MNGELPSATLRSPIVNEQGPSSCMTTATLRLLQRHTPQSVFQPKIVPVFNQRDVPDSDGKCHVLVWLLTESIWQLTVASLDNKLQRLRREAANESSNKAFSLLKDFRRQIADARMLIAELRERHILAVGEAESWLVDKVSVSVDDFWSQDRSKPAPVVFGRAQFMDMRNLPESMETLENRINAMTQAINEEIQVVIGSVQIEDADTMKRQAELTMFLAVLAAIFLPMTLVTGIFGMNIIETNSDPGRPDKHAVIKTSSVAFGITYAMVFLYLAMRLLRVFWVDKREKLRENP